MSSIKIDLKDEFKEVKISKSILISEGTHQDVSLKQVIKGSIIEISFDESLNLKEGQQFRLEFE
ncbi:MAG: hypothetical protein ACTSO6_12370 [Promethearchaeota archaeon]